MSVSACAALVEKGDPERFRAAMAAPPEARRVLFPLYAFNVEVARAPWVTQEAMIAEMRLQWWRDALEEIAGDGPARRHEVVDALAEVLDAEGARALDRLVAARRWDVYKDAFENAAHFEEYIEATTGALMATAARLLGPCDAVVVGEVAHASGVANFLRAIPALEAAGRVPLLDGRPEGVRALAGDALARLDRARARRREVSKEAGAALLSAHLARPVLKAAVADPSAVAAGTLDPGPLRQSLRLARVAAQGWWA